MPRTRTRPSDLAHDRRAAASFFDVADDFLEQILDRDEAGGAAVLVHHDRHLRAEAAHRGEHLVERRRRRDVRQRLAHRWR